MTTVNAASDAGRARAESLMVDTCRIYDEGPPVLNTTTGKTTRTQTTWYSGKCRARPSTQSSGADAAETQMELVPYVVSVPLSVTNVKTGAIVELTASRDGSLVGKRLSVVSIARGTHITARRLACQEVAGG